MNASHPLRKTSLLHGLSYNKLAGLGILSGVAGWTREGGLPPIIKIHIRDSPSGKWLEGTFRYSVDHAETSGPCGAAVVAKLSELLFVETLRRYIAQLPTSQTGWLAGVCDPDVGKALALLHKQASHPWTIASLAEEVGLSHSVLAERFRHYLSDTPMGYLTRWRL